MTHIISNVKSVEQDLVNKEKQLEQKMSDVLAAANHTGDWGVDLVHQQPLSPHAPVSYINLSEKLHDFKDKVQGSVAGIKSNIMKHLDTQNSPFKNSTKNWRWNEDSESDFLLALIN